MKRTFMPLGAVLLLTLCCVSPVRAATAVDTVHVDLDPLIDAAVNFRNRFAVDVHHSISSASNGTWSRNGSTSTWVYSARIPTAVSMSFHASDLQLPPSAVLKVSSSRNSANYVAHDVSRGGLWGRPLAGDTLEFALTVNIAEASQVRLQIDSLQAGYRGLGGRVADHPHYARVMKLAAAPTAADCTQNYSCNASAANQGPANATVALIVGNMYQCTGTLLNDTRGDGTPYILTARHCQSGKLGGGNPNAAATVSVYWDAVTACGTGLGSIYDGTVVSQTGAVSVVEQQDAWLIRLDAPPVANDAYYSGWDATGGVFNGGYSIHHALGKNKQYVEWNGQSLLQRITGTTLKVGYDSTFWGLVNAVGNVGAGASGGAVFDPNNHVVGSASLALLPNGENAAGVCPATPPAVPTPSTITAQYTALAAIWTSTADPTSSTGATTLQSALDPDATGQMILPGSGTLPITITADRSGAISGDMVTLSWDVPTAQSCTAAGGFAADGWAGPKPTSGTMQVTEEAGGDARYSLSCLIGNRIGHGTATVTWNYIQPTVGLVGPSSAITVGADVYFNWVANVTPCTATGGISGDGWAGSGTMIDSRKVVAAHTGVIKYNLTCGTGARTASSSLLVDIVPPLITLVADATQLRVGQIVSLSWFGAGTGGKCSAGGGSGTDNWALYNSNIPSNGSSSVTEATAGTYIYTLTCTSGGQSASSSVTVAFTNDAPAISLVANSSRQQIYPSGGTPSDGAQNLIWTSNVRGCLIDYTPPGGQQTHPIYLEGEAPTGSAMDTESVPGLYTYTLRCGGLSASTTIEWVSTPTMEALTASSYRWAANVGYPLTWSGGSGPCIGGGGSSGDGWAGAKNVSGTQSISESRPGTYTFTLTCGSGASLSRSQVTVVVPPPAIQIYSTGVPADQATNIAWSSTVGPCTYVDSSSGNSAGQQVLPRGSATSKPATSGIYLYTLTCGSGSTKLYASTTVAVNVAAPTTLSANATTVPVNTAVTLTWNSSGGICYASGGTGNDPWRGTLGGTGAGTMIVTSQYSGIVNYGINCNGRLAQTSVTYTAVTSTTAAAPTPTVTLSANAATQVAGQSISLAWTSQNADSCAAAGGATGDGWSGILALSGSMSVTETSAGQVTYSIICTGAPPAAIAMTTVTIKSSAGAPAASGGTSGGGGGAIDWWLLLFLSLPLGARLHARAVLDGQKR